MLFKTEIYKTKEKVRKGPSVYYRGVVVLILSLNSDAFCYPLLCSRKAIGGKEVSGGKKATLHVSLLPTFLLLN